MCVSVTFPSIMSSNRSSGSRGIVAVGQNGQCLSRTLDADDPTWALTDISFSHS